MISHTLINYFTSSLLLLILSWYSSHVGSTLSFPSHFSITYDQYHSNPIKNHWYMCSINGVISALHHDLVITPIMVEYKQRMPSMSHEYWQIIQLECWGDLLHNFWNIGTHMTVECKYESTGNSWFKVVSTTMWVPLLTILTSVEWFK